MNNPAPEIAEFAADDGVNLRYRVWNPIRPRGVVVCLHGIRSHGAWYMDSCAHLCRHGYRVAFPDRRGSGLNRGKGEDGLRYRKWIRDVESVIRIAVRDLPGKPLHLMGISWGGRLAVAVATAGGVKLKSLILSSPGLVSLLDYPFRLKLAVIFSHIFKLDRKFLIPLDDPVLFTDDPDEQNYIEEDALGLRRATPRFLIESRKLERVARARCSDIRWPAFLLLAERDRIVDNDGVKKLFSRSGSADKIVKIYPKARHTLEFDACRKQYFEDLVNWLDKHS